MKLLVSADLPNPATVGWSETTARKASKFFLNTSVFLELRFLSSKGSRLKILAPLNNCVISFPFRLLGKTF